MDVRVVSGLGSGHSEAAALASVYPPCTGAGVCTRFSRVRTDRPGDPATPRPKGFSQVSLPHQRLRTSAGRLRTGEGWAPAVDWGTAPPPPPAPCPPHPKPLPLTTPSPVPPPPTHRTRPSSTAPTGSPTNPPQPSPPPPHSHSPQNHRSGPSPTAPTPHPHPTPTQPWSSLL